MNGKRIIGLIAWLILVVALGFATFGMFGSRHGHYGPRAGWQGQGWMPYPQNGYGMGPGGAVPYGGADTELGPPPLAALDLTPEQAGQIKAMRSALAEQEFALFGKISEQQERLNALYAAEPQDWGAIGKALDAILDLQRQQIAARVAAEQKAQALLSDGQRKEWSRLMRTYGWMGGREP